MWPSASEGCSWPPCSYSPDESFSFASDLRKDDCTWAQKRQRGPTLSLPGWNTKEFLCWKNQANGNWGLKVPRRRDPGAESWRQKRTGQKLKVSYCMIKNRREDVYWEESKCWLQRLQVKGKPEAPGEMQRARGRGNSDVCLASTSLCKFTSARRTCLKWGTQVEITNTGSRDPQSRRRREPGGTGIPLASP